MTVAHVKGTQGYFPERMTWRDGSTKWDLWSIVAIILECDMNVDDYAECDGEHHSIYKAKNHLA
jgi:hypothetical protein